MQPDRVINNLNDIEPNSQVAIYGAGRQGHSLHISLKRIRPDIQIIAFLDDSLSMPNANPPVIHPEDPYNNITSSTTILVPHSIGQRISHQHTSLPGTVIFLHPDLNLAHKFLPEERSILLPRESAVCQLLPNEDAYIFRNLMNARTVSYPTPNLNRYPVNGAIYLDYMNLQTISTVICGGIADGGIEMNMIRRMPNLKSMTGFDPFPELYHQSPAKRTLQESNLFHFVPQGLWSTPTTLSLHKDGQGSFLNEQSTPENQVNAISLDQYTKEYNQPHIDLIKLDVEGSEIEALQGAQRTIQKDRPAIAVCIYHNRMDMLTIPEFLSDSLQNYHFRIGHYSLGLTDTVIYAIPDEKS